MDVAEFKKKWDSIPVATPDETDDLDREMLTRAEKTKNDPTYTLEDIMTSREKRRGRMTIRLPKTMQDALIRSAAEEGISLNQYVLHTITAGEIAIRVMR